MTSSALSRSFTWSRRFSRFSCLNFAYSAGSKTWERGEEYLEMGVVHDLSHGGDTVTALVQGTRPYDVRFHAGSGGLEWTCSCDHCADGFFCKHLVAVGLAWLERESRPGRKAVARPTREQIALHLGGLPKDELVARLLDASEWDPALRKMIELELVTARASGQKGPDAEALRTALTQALDDPEDVPWNEADDYADRIEVVVAEIEKLARKEHAPAMLPLIEEALLGLEDAMGHISGEGAGVQMLHERVVALHREACLLARPDPVELARRLFDWGLTGEWGTFEEAAETYREVLGANGLAEYRRLADAVWNKIPALGPANSRGRFDESRRRITRLMESLARATGSVDDLVAIMSRDLSSPSAFLSIAETLKIAGRRPDALAWAERGDREFPGHADDALRRFLTDEYLHAGRAEEALRVAREDFDRMPCVPRWLHLKSVAQLAKRWPETEQAALDVLRRIAASEAAPLVQVLIEEQRIEEAWRAAIAAPCPLRLRAQLATLRGEKHPADGLPVWQEALAVALRESREDNYREAVACLRRIAACLRALKREGEFEGILATTRTANRARRKFIAMLDRARWE